jgi:hypothetical protein
VCEEGVSRTKRDRFADSDWRWSTKSVPSRVTHAHARANEQRCLQAVEQNFDEYDIFSDTPIFHTTWARGLSV